MGGCRCTRGIGHMLRCFSLKPGTIPPFSHIPSLSDGTVQEFLCSVAWQPVMTFSTPIFEDRRLHNIEYTFILFSSSHYNRQGRGEANQTMTEQQAQTNCSPVAVPMFVTKLVLYKFYEMQQMEELGVATVSRYIPNKKQCSRRTEGDEVLNDGKTSPRLNSSIHVCCSVHHAS